MIAPQTSPHPQQRLGGDDRLDGVLGVAVGADLVGPGARRRGAADHDLDAVAQAGGLEGLDRLLLVGHRGGEQGARAGAGRRCVSLTLATKVSTGTSQPTSVTVKPAAREHAADDRLADLVDVAGDGAGDGHAERSAASAGGVEGGLQDGDGGLHRLGALDQLGEEELALAEEVADLLDALDEALVEDVAGGRGRRRGPPGRGASASSTSPSMTVCFICS